MEDLERLGREDVQPRPQQNDRRRIVWSQALCTFSYLFFEAICYVSFLSVSIGLSAFIAISFEYFVFWKISAFAQTYITLFLFMNFACAQARHQSVYIYHIRDRFGPYVFCCFYCTYPWSLWFALLTVAYFNLFYQFKQLFCSEPIQYPGQSQTNSYSKLPTLSGTIPEIRITTALFLLSLSSIQYLTCRKLRWDYHLEASQVPEPPVLPSCTAYLSAVFVLLLVQAIVSVLYIMPFLLWLLIARLFHWSIDATVFTAVIVSILVGYFGSFVERQEPFPTINRNRMFHIINLKLRTTIVCLITIPLVSFWFYKAEEYTCLTGIPKDKHGPSGLDIFNFFLMNICLCILNTVKYSSLSAHARREREVEMRLNRQLQENRVRPAGPDPILEGRVRIAGLNNSLNREPVSTVVNAAAETSPSNNGSKIFVEEGTMDRDGNMASTISSNGFNLTKEPISNDISKPLDRNSNDVQVTVQASDMLHAVSGIKSFKKSFATKVFHSDHQLPVQSKVSNTKSDSKLLFRGPELPRKPKKSEGESWDSHQVREPKVSANDQIHSVRSPTSTISAKDNPETSISDAQASAATVDPTLSNPQLPVQVEASDDDGNIPMSSKIILLRSKSSYKLRPDKMPKFPEK